MKSRTKKRSLSAVLFILGCFMTIWLIFLLFSSAGCEQLNRPESPPKRFVGAGGPVEGVATSGGLTVHRDGRLERLLDALERVESGRNPGAIGDGGNSVGILQISTIMVRDVNRLMGGTLYHFKDRLSVEKSRAMARIYFAHYCRGMSWEQMAACWVAGPDGYTQMDEPAVRAYIEKVRSVI